MHDSDNIPHLPKVVNVGNWTETFTQTELLGKVDLPTLVNLLKVEKGYQQAPSTCHACGHEHLSGTVHDSPTREPLSAVWARLDYPSCTQGHRGTLAPYGGTGTLPHGVMRAWSADDAADVWPNVQQGRETVGVRAPAGTGHALAGVPDPDGWQVWQGSDFESDGTPKVHKVRGQRNHAKMHEHLAWCTLPGCDETHKCYKSDHHAPAKGRPGWTCPTHGVDSVKGCVLDAPLETAEKRSTAVRRNQRKVTDLLEGKLTPNERKGSVLRVPRGKALRPEPTDPVMADNRYPVRTTAAAPDSGKVLVYGWSVLGHPHGPWSDKPVKMDKLREAGYLLKVLNKDGSPVKRNPAKRAMASLVARDAHAVDAVEATIVRSGGRSTASRTATAAARNERRNAAKRAGRLVTDSSVSSEMAF